MDKRGGKMSIGGVWPRDWKSKGNNDLETTKCQCFQLKTNTSKQLYDN